MIALVAFLVCLAFLCIAAVFIAALIGRVFMAFGRYTERQRLIESAQYEANRAAEWEARARVAEARLGERGQPFRAGETVVLNSGGPLMTILEVDSEQAKCEWDDGDSKRQLSFSIKTIRRTTDLEPPVRVIDDTAWRDELGIWTPPTATARGMDDEWPDEIGG